MSDGQITNGQRAAHAGTASTPMRGHRPRALNQANGRQHR